MYRMNPNVIAMCKNVALEKIRSVFSKPKRDSLRSGGEKGSEYMHRLLYTHSRLCHEQLRLESEAFLKLVEILVSRELLCDSKFISVVEQLGMCLYILAKGASYRDVADTFKHSVSTVHKYYVLVLEALKVLAFDIIRPHTSLNEIPIKIRNSRRHSPFKDCVGALDGTHIQATIGDDEGNQYRGRKGSKTWNVLACCSFDMLFTYVHVGWEGSVHDQTVWIDSISQPKYCFPRPPPGKYYLVDSGYPNTLGYLAPYKTVRYHMPAFAHGSQPTGIFENFNYRHSSLRTTIERAFGILKNTWKVLKSMPVSEDVRQMDIIMATITLHNFIRMHRLHIPILAHPLVPGYSDTGVYDRARKEQMDQVRDSIAVQIYSSHPTEDTDDMIVDDD